jgi:hypothetical protein
MLVLLPLTLKPARAARAVWLRTSVLSALRLLSLCLTRPVRDGGSVKWRPFRARIHLFFRWWATLASSPESHRCYVSGTISLPQLIHSSVARVGLDTPSFLPTRGTGAVYSAKNWGVFIWTPHSSRDPPLWSRPASGADLGGMLFGVMFGRDSTFISCMGRLSIRMN